MQHGARYNTKHSQVCKHRVTHRCALRLWLCALHTEEVAQASKTQQTLLRVAVVPQEAATRPHC